MNNEQELERLGAILCLSIGSKRYEHTLGVVECARKLAQVYAVDTYKAELAALLHDCGREIKLTDSVEYARAQGLKINKVECLQPILLHAKIGRLIAKSKYAVADKQVLQAIECHTTGNKKMSDIAMVVYIADMLERGRDFPEVDYLRSLIGNLSLPELMLSCLRATLEHLLIAGLFVHLDSIKTYNSLLRAIDRTSQICRSI